MSRPHQAPGVPASWGGGAYHGTWPSPRLSIQDEAELRSREVTGSPENLAWEGGCGDTSLRVDIKLLFSASSVGTRSAGASGLAPREPSVLDDTASQPGDSDEAFDFFEQQDEVQPPTLGLSSKVVEKPLEEEEEEEEEALDPLGIMR